MIITSSRLRFLFSVKLYNAEKNYYQVLTISEKADTSEIKKAFRNLAKKYHPDSVNGKEEKFKEVNEAYQVLSNATVKQEYDQVRATNTRSHSYQSSPSSGNQSSGNYSQHSSSQQQGYQQSSSQYRGYQKEEGWQNKGFREQFMNDLYQQQKNEHMRNSQQASREQMERAFNEMMQEAMRKDPRENIRQYNQQMKAKQE